MDNVTMKAIKLKIIIQNALFIIEETGISNYKFKELDDHERVDDAFIKSLDCINELEEEDYEVIGDFTVGTKPMVAGLVMACIEKNIEYKYLGAKRSATFPMVVPVYGRNNMSWEDDRCASAFVSSTTYFPRGRFFISANPLLSVFILSITCPFV